LVIGNWLLVIGNWLLVIGNLPVTIHQLLFTSHQLSDFYFFVERRADDNISRNRIYAGVCFKVLGNLTGEVFYLWQSSRSSGDWNDTNILGTRLKFRF